MSRTNLVDYEKLMGSLKGNAFQDAVCARLQNTYVDFQSIPAKPHGDGGLDGLSHRQEHAYCCYGPEQDSRKLDNQGLKKDIVNKFSSDLQKLFELETEKRILRNKPNGELDTIMGKDRKIKHIFLIVSWFESHRVIGPLNTNFDKYKTASLLKFVDADATLTVWGPKNLADLGAVDDHMLFRIQNPALFERLNTASAAELIENDGGDFTAKFDDLKRRQPEKASRIESISEKLREAWATEIALDDDLSQNSLLLHQTLETVRSDAALSADLKSISLTDPYQLISAMRVEVAKLVDQGFGDRFGPHSSRITEGIIASLIGECPIDWREDHV